MKQKFGKTIETLQEFSIPLLAGVVLAVILANVDPGGYESLIHWSPLGHGSHFNLHFLVNDILMVFFFAIATKEIVESCLPGGDLNPPRKAINPLMATIGGVVGPVAVYFAIVAISGDSSISNGWGIPTATDIALAWLLARIIFGKGHPAISFLLLLAIVDDGIGLGIIAVFYPDPAHPVNPAWLGLVGAAIAVAWALRKKDVQNFWWYIVIPGGLAWAGLYAAHLHPALALVPVIPFIPAAKRDEGLFAEQHHHGDGHHHDPLNQFEHTFKLPVDFGLFFFGLANAGVALSTVGNATWAVLGALMLGKTGGIFAFSYAADKLGFPLPKGMNLRALLVVGIIASLGLTVALFVAGVAFTAPGLQGAAKTGALLSVLAIPAAIFAARLLRIKKWDATQQATAHRAETHETVPSAVEPTPASEPSRSPVRPAKTRPAGIRQPASTWV